MPDSCAVTGCDRNVKSKELCGMHYNRKLRGHPEDGNPPRKRPPCKFEGCDRPNSARGYCGSHVWQMKHIGTMTPIAAPTDRICKGPSCDRPARRFAEHGLCPTHDRQMRDRGYLSPIRDSRPLRDPEVFWTYTRRTSSGCWEWQANVTPAGYGMLNAGGKKFVYAHRHSWELARGPIPQGLTIDHLCRNTRCVNPDHLEPVTQAENNRRAREAKAARMAGGAA